MASNCKRPDLRPNRLCSSCSDIRLHQIVLPPADQNDLTLHRLDVQNIGYDLKDGQDLIARYKECDLCLVIAYLAMDLDTVRNMTGGIGDLPIGSLQARPIKLLTPIGYQQPSDGSLGLQHVRVAFPEVLSPSHSKFASPYLSTGRVLNLAADPASPAAVNGDIFGRPSLRNHGGDEALELIRRRLATCIKHHGGLCDRTTSGVQIKDTSTTLPTRLIHIDKRDHTVLRLEQTWLGQQGAYVALSHCWGPEDKRPLCTTRANVNQHLTDIPWVSVPKTFQDAVIVTLAVGLEYIWIDSLCIIQDDENDWDQESPQMRSVYQNAHFTVAAAQAQNANEGLFFDRSLLPSPWTVKVPYFDRHGVAKGSILVKPGPPDPDTLLMEDPHTSNLSKRAWVLQEEMLSRRVVYFLFRNIFWKCKALRVSETEEPSYMESLTPMDIADWTTIVENYTERKMSVPRDKLIALAGLADEFALCAPTDRYLNGIWLNNVHRQLLWRREDEPRLISNAAIDMPSWSWASIQGPVTFLEQVVLVNVMPAADVVPRSGRVLDVVGFCVPLNYSSPVVSAPRAHGVDHYICPCDGAFNNSGMQPEHNNFFTEAVIPFFPEDKHIITDSAHNIVGYAIFDDPDLTCLDAHQLYHYLPTLQGTWISGAVEQLCYYGLLLHKVITNDRSSVTQTYKRVGIVVLTIPEIWLQASMSSTKLILI